MAHLALRPLTLAVLGMLAACSSGGESAAPPSEAAPDVAAAPAPAPAGPAAIDSAKLANPCLFNNEDAAKVLGASVSKTEPESMGTMMGCSYRAGDASLRLNLIVHDPVYFEKAIAATRGTRPGEKADIAGDADKAWWQTGEGTGVTLHYYRQNVEVEVTTTGLGDDPAKLKPLLQALPRVP